MSPYDIEFQPKRTRDAKPDKSRSASAEHFLAMQVRALGRLISETQPTGLDAELHQEFRAMADKQGMTDHGGAFLPNPILTRAGLDSKTSTKGSELDFVQQGEYVGPTAPRSVLQNLATVIPDDHKISHVVQTGRATADFVTENAGSDTGAVDFTLGLAAATPKQIFATVPVSYQLLRMSAIVQAKVIVELIRAIWSRIELVAFNGSGSGVQPTGIIVNSSTTKLPVGTNGGAVTSALLSHMVRALGENGAEFPDSKLAYITTPAVRTEAMQLPRGTGTEAVWHSSADVFGYPGFATSNVPSNLTKGTSTTVCHAAIFGDWAELYIHASPQIELIVDPVSLKKQGVVEVSAYLMADVALPRPTSFIVIPDITVPAL